MNNLMRNSTSDPYGHKKLQNVILNIAYDIDSFCEKYDITYCLMGGSALGAKRHKGFIPWDDDLDIFMTPDNYEKFRMLFKKRGNFDKYYLQELGSTRGKVTTAKLRLNNSYYEESILKGWKIHHGIYVDIFILHTCPNNSLKRFWQYAWAKYIVVKGLANKRYKRRGPFIYILLKLLKVFPKRFLLDFGLRQVYMFRGDKTSFYCNYLGKALLRNGTYKKEYFEKVKKVPFERIKLNVGVGLEDFLKDRFGCYMKKPSPERIKYEQHATSWGIGEKYKYEDTSDEKYLF